MADGDYRDIWISLAAFLPIVALSSLLLQGNPGARGTVVIVAFFGAILLRHSIAERERRRHEDD